METNANYALIGAFALAGFLGILAFFLWFARIELDRQFDYYDIDFPTVSGLGEASDVRFAGLPVGQVVDVRLSPEQDGRVRVRIEVAANTPIRTDSVATIESQGVTGVSFVGISPGSPEAEFVVSANGAVPKITAGQSVFQSLSEDAPRLVTDTLVVIEDLQRLFGPENQLRVEAILENAQRSTEAFSQALDSFSEVGSTISDFSGEIERINEMLAGLVGDVSGALETAEQTLGNVDLLIADARGLITESTETVAEARGPIQEVERYLSDSLGPATDDLRRVAQEIETQFTSLTESANGLLATYAETGSVATARLTEAQETIRATNALIDRMNTAAQNVSSAAASVDLLIAEDATALLSELRSVVAEVAQVTRTISDSATADLPQIMSDIREATSAGAALIAEIDSNLTSATGRIDGLTESAAATLETVQTTFANANTTLSSINAALETGDRALLAAESAFAGADQWIQEDAGALSGQLRTTLSELDKAIAAVAEDIPAVTEGLRDASRSAETAFAQIEATAASAGPAVRDFAVTALPQYTRVAVETRNLIQNLGKLVDQISRDPSRFFLEPRAPEFRR